MSLPQLAARGQVANDGLEENAVPDQRLGQAEHLEESTVPRDQAQSFIEDGDALLQPVEAVLQTEQLVGGWLLVHYPRIMHQIGGERLRTSIRGRPGTMTRRRASTRTNARCARGCIARAKTRSRCTAARELGADPKDCWAYGDSRSDIEMLDFVGNPVAVNPRRALRRVAKERGWRIVRWSQTEDTARGSPAR